MLKIYSFLMAGVAGLLPAKAMAESGYPGSWELGLQEPAGPLKAEIDDFHTMLLYIITAIVIVVTILLAYAVIAFRRRKGREAADFAHNTMIEVIWTLVPVIILIVIAIPSFKLLYLEDRVHDPDMTIKVTGYQWYWGYEYTDYDGLEFLSYMVPENEIDADAGQMRLLSTDNPVVVPVDTNIQLLVTAADVLHSFALPAAGVKKDAVPGRMNETWMRIEKPGTYFGQCSEICGTGHAYMPIEIKAVTKDEFDAWTQAQGATLKPNMTEETKEEDL